MIASDIEYKYLVNHPESHQCRYVNNYGNENLEHPLRDTRVPSCFVSVWTKTGNSPSILASLPLGSNAFCPKCVLDAMNKIEPTKLDGEDDRTGEWYK
jgi:hypothetical protein